MLYQYRCHAAGSAITCVVAKTGRGFRISASGGVTRIGTPVSGSSVSKSSPSTATAPTPPLVQFYSQGWFCDMAAGGVSCENPKGYTARLSPTGKVTVCTAEPAACKVAIPKYMPSTLADGKQVTVEPFRCSYATAGLNCIVIATGHGFQISPDNSVTPVGP